MTNLHKWIKLNLTDIQKLINLGKSTKEHSKHSSAIVLFLYLIKNMNKDNYIYQSIKYISNKLHFTSQTMYKNRDLLEENDIIKEKIRKDSHKKKYQMPPIYIEKEIACKIGGSKIRKLYLHKKWAQLSMSHINKMIHLGKKHSSALLLFLEIIKHMNKKNEYITSIRNIEKKMDMSRSTISRNLRLLNSNRWNFIDIYNTGIFHGYAVNDSIIWTSTFTEKPYISKFRQLENKKKK